MNEAVLTSIDTGADISATPDTGAGGASGTGAPEAAGSPASGTGTEGQGTPDAGSAAPAKGADAQSAVGDPGQGDGKQGVVPHAALHEVRLQNKALHAKIAELEAIPRLTTEQQKLLDRLTAQEQANAPKDPDFLEDPKGYVDSKLTKAEAALKKLDDSDKERQQRDNAQQELSTLLSTVSTREQEFVKTTPDYYDAVTHIRQVRGAQLQMIYPQATAEQISRQITSEEVSAARQLLQNGGNPVEFAYNYAKTLGYAPKAPAGAAANGAPAKETPKVDKDAVRSMGGGGAASTDNDDAGDEMPEFSSALAERFGVRKRK
jgi:hypothetical protein